MPEKFGVQLTILKEKDIYSLILFLRLTYGVFINFVHYSL